MGQKKLFEKKYICFNYYFLKQDSYENTVILEEETPILAEHYLKKNLYWIFVVGFQK